MRPLVTVFALAVAASCAAGGIASAAAAKPATAKACVAGNGQLSLLARGKCAAHTKGITLGTTGPAGARGAAGATGPMGNAGTVGATGATGSRGPAGPSDAWSGSTSVALPAGSYAISTGFTFFAEEAISASVKGPGAYTASGSCAFITPTATVGVVRTEGAMSPDSGYYVYEATPGTTSTITLSTPQTVTAYCNDSLEDSSGDTPTAPSPFFQIYPSIVAVTVGAVH